MTHANRPLMRAVVRPVVLWSAGKKAWLRGKTVGWQITTLGGSVVLLKSPHDELLVLVSTFQDADALAVRLPCLRVGFASR